MFWFCSWLARASES